MIDVNECVDDAGGYCPILFTINFTACVLFLFLEDSPFLRSIDGYGAIAVLETTSHRGRGAIALAGDSIATIWADAGEALTPWIAGSLDRWMGSLVGTPR